MDRFARSRHPVQPPIAAGFAVELAAPALRLMMWLMDG